MHTFYMLLTLQRISSYSNQIIIASSHIICSANMQQNSRANNNNHNIPRPNSIKKGRKSEDHFKCAEK